MSASTGRPPDHDSKRRRIVEAAAEVFYERGFVAGTTKEIAAKVGLSQPAIYHYVGSKDLLLREIALHVDKHMMEVLERGMARGSTAREQLVAIIEEFTAAVVEDRKLFAVYYKELHTLPEETRQQIAAHEADFVTGVAAVVVRLQREGVLREDKPTTAVTEAILGMVSWVHRWYRPTGPLDAEAIAHVFTTLLGLDAPARGAG